MFDQEMFDLSEAYFQQPGLLVAIQKDGMQYAGVLKYEELNFSLLKSYYEGIGQ